MPEADGVSLAGQVDTRERMGAFFHEYVWEKKAPPPGMASVTRTVPK